MVSNLKWLTGFDWPSLLTFLFFLLLSIISHEVFRWLFVVCSILSGCWLLYKYYIWNGTPWRKVHFRGMLIYAALSGVENSIAQNEGRDFNKINACRDMALYMCGPDREIFVNAMIEELRKEKGKYFSNLIKQYSSIILPEISQDNYKEIIDACNIMDFNPQLVIGNIIENTYGGEEATHYAIALLSGKAF